MEPSGASCPAGRAVAPLGGRGLDDRDGDERPAAEPEGALEDALVVARPAEVEASDRRDTEAASPPERRDDARKPAEMRPDPGGERLHEGALARHLDRHAAGSGRILENRPPLERIERERCKEGPGHRGEPPEELRGELRRERFPAASRKGRR